jgi:hypothetical protein
MAKTGTRKKLVQAAPHAAFNLDPIVKSFPEASDTLLVDKRLSWPDGVELDAEGRWLYITANQLHRLPVLNGGLDESKPPFHVLRLRVDAPMTESKS